MCPGRRVRTVKKDEATKKTGIILSMDAQRKIWKDYSNGELPMVTLSEKQIAWLNEKFSWQMRNKFEKVKK